jgi:NAD(P)-dependent dehydrogenase (short-subunit alcohol dehydrogenase family)
MPEHTGRTYVITGADSGIGAVTAERLEAADAHVVRCGIGPGVDVRADLATAAGRTSAVEQVRALAPAGIDGVALVAGSAEPGIAVGLNYFGTITLLTALRADLARGPEPRAVVVSSASSLSAGDTNLVDACLADDEPRATVVAERLMEQGRGTVIYRSTKIALNRWLRRTAVQEDWAGARILLNAVAPGIVATETAHRTMLADDATARVLQDALPQPLGMPGPVEPVAGRRVHHRSGALRGRRCRGRAAW